MRIKKKIIVLMLVSLCLSGCGKDVEQEIEIKHNDADYDYKDEIEVWTQSEDLKQFAQKYEEQTGIKVNVTRTDLADYEDKINDYFRNYNNDQNFIGPDVFIAEPQMLERFYDKGYFANLDNYGAAEYEGQQVDYAWELGIDDRGIHRTLTYQINPVGFYYRADVAREVFGTDDPEEVGKLFADYSSILDAAEKLKNAGYIMFASEGELRYSMNFAEWVDDGKFNMHPCQFELIDTIIQMKNSGYMLNYEEFSDYWYQGMTEEVPLIPDEVLTEMKENPDEWGEEEIESYVNGCDTANIFAYGLPSWGIIIMKDALVNGNYEWKVCEGPYPGYGGGSFLGINSNSTKKMLAWDFIRFCTLDEDVAEWWVKESNDVPVLKAVLDRHLNDENELLGNEKTFKIWKNESDKIENTNLTRYSTYFDDLVYDTVDQILDGELTRQEASLYFYSSIDKKFPELNVDYSEEKLWAQYSNDKVGAQMLRNANFANGMSGWKETITTWGEYQITDAYSVPGNGGIVYKIANSGTEDWNIQLRQSDIGLERGCTYRVSFVANSTADRKIKSGVINSNGVTFYGGRDAYLPAGTDVVVSYDIKMDYDTNVEFYISMGKNLDEESTASDISISGLSIMRIS